MAYTSPGQYDCNIRAGFLRKNEDEQLEVLMCFDDFLAGDEKILYDDWDATEGITILSTYNSSPHSVTAIIEGGEAGKVYAIAATIDSDKDQHIRLAKFISVVEYP